MKKQFFIFFILNIFIFHEFQAEPIRHRFRLFSPEYRKVIADFKKALAEKNDALETLHYWEKELKEKGPSEDMMIECSMKSGAVMIWPEKDCNFFTHGKYSTWSDKEKAEYQKQRNKEHQDAWKRWEEEHPSNKYYENIRIAEKYLAWTIQEHKRIQAEHDALSEKLYAQETEKLKELLLLSAESLQTIGEGDVQI